MTPPTPLASGEPAGSASPVVTRGRQLTDLLYSGQLEELWATFTPQVQSEWGTFSAFKAYRAEGDRRYGAEAQVLKEETTRDGDVTYYTRTATFQRGQRTPWTVIFGLNTQGKVQEFGIVGAGVLPGSLASPAR